jgi:hypothetical protein
MFCLRLEFTHLVLFKQRCVAAGAGSCRGPKWPPCSKGRQSQTCPRRPDRHCNRRVMAEADSLAAVGSIQSSF